VWDVSVFRYLLQRYPTFEVSVAGQEMMPEAASATPQQVQLRVAVLAKAATEARSPGILVFS
jgi:hypothetical protein